MKRLVITGNIASGKSTVTKYLQDNHFIIIDEDKISRDFFFKHYDELCKLFNWKGEGLRKYLADNVFKDKEMLIKLENFLYPLIYQEVNKYEEKLKNIYHIFDSALFFEKYNKTENDFVILISVPKDIQLKRLMERNGYDEETAKNRINSQMSVEEKRKLADYEIENTGNLEELYFKIEELLKFERIYE